MAGPADRQKTALVTGAGRRLGRAIAAGLAEQGYAVALHHNASAAGAGELAREIRDGGGQAVAIGHDFSAADTAGELVGKAAAALGGPVSVLINSASAFDKDQLTTLTPESWRFLIDVNVTAPVFLMQAFANQAPPPAAGAIVNILDTQMTSASPARFSYFCGKFALEGATRLAAYDLAPKGIRVNAVAPGLVLPSGQNQETYERRQRLTPLGPGLGAQDIVEAVLYLVSAPQVTGHVLVVDAGQRLMGFGNAPIG